MTNPLSFSERLAALNAEKAKEEQPAKPDVPEEDIPEVYSERSDHDTEMDRIISGIGILDAYRKWIFGGPKTIDNKTLSRRESLMVSCPNPDHPDTHPSAWLNVDKNTWFCGGCQEGGDIYDLAAIKFGFPRPDYKSGQMFHELREQMAESYGYRVMKLIDGTKTVYKEESDQAGDDPVSTGTSQVDTAGTLEVRTPASPETSSVPAEKSTPSDTQDKSGSSDTTDKSIETGQSSNVSQMWAEEDEEEEIKFPVIDWQKLAPEGTFIYEYCVATSHDDSPEEYHFFHSLLALAHVVGKNVFLDDTHPVYGNMLVCLLGGTGYGKTRSRLWLNQVLRSVCPFKDNGLDCSGVKIVTPPASGEHLIKSFQHIAHDPSFGKNAPTVHTSVNGIVDFDEFSSLLNRANRQGSILKPIIMGLADGQKTVSTGSITSGDIEAVDPFCSITSSTQPKAVRTLLSKIDTSSGFLNRWIFVGGRRKGKEIVGGNRSTINVDLSKAKVELGNVKAWGAIERPVFCTDEGYRALEKFFRGEIFPLQDQDDTDLLKRLDLLMKRFILLFCINERVTEATRRHVELAASMLNYLIYCYGTISDEIGITLMGEMTGEILRHIRRHFNRTKRGASARDLQMYMKGRHYNPELIKRALETMIALDMIEIENSKFGNSKVGRPSVRYKEVMA